MWNKRDKGYKLTASRRHSNKDLRSLLLALWFAGMVTPCPLMFAFDRRLGVKRVGLGFNVVANSRKGTQSTEVAASNDVAL